MATVVATFSGNLTDTSNVATAANPATKPVLMIYGGAGGYVKVSVAVRAVASSNAVMTEISPAVKAGETIQWTPELFKSPFHEVIVTTTGYGTVTGIIVQLVEV